jgi:hypothetical protein
LLYVRGDFNTLYLTKMMTIGSASVITVIQDPDTGGQKDEHPSGSGSEPLFRSPILA